MKNHFLVFLFFLGTTLAAQNKTGFGLRAGGLLTHAYDSKARDYLPEPYQVESTILQPILRVLKRWDWQSRCDLQTEVGYTGGGYRVVDPLERDKPSWVGLQKLEADVLLLYDLGFSRQFAPYLIGGLSYSYLAKVNYRQNAFLPPVRISYDDRQTVLAQLGLGSPINRTGSLAVELRLTHDVFVEPHRATFQMTGVWFW